MFEKSNPIIIFSTKGFPLQQTLDPPNPYLLFKSNLELIKHKPTSQHRNSSLTSCISTQDRIQERQLLRAYCAAQLDSRSLSPHRLCNILTEIQHVTHLVESLCDGIQSDYSQIGTSVYWQTRMNLEGGIIDEAYGKDSIIEVNLLKGRTSAEDKWNWGRNCEPMITLGLRQI